MPNLPRGHVRHLTHRRLRVKIPDKRGDAAFFKKVEEKVGSWNSVSKVETNPLTGSVLVHFLDLAALFAENAVANDLFSVEFDEVTDARDVTQRAADAFRAADAAISRWCGGSADLRGAIFLALLAGGVYQLVRGEIKAPAATLLWYAGAMLRVWEHPAGGGESAGRPG